MEKEVRKELIKNLKNYKELLDSKAKIQGFPDDKFQKLFDQKTEDIDLLNKNLLLKEMLSEYLEGSYENQAVNFWIIKNWGGIRFKDNDGYQKRITKMGGLLNKYEKGKLTNEDDEIIIERISSLSKVASFVKPQNYFIYDSRAVFSLNWLLYKSGEKRDYYCQPQSQGKIAPYFLSTFIHEKLDVTMEKSVNVHKYLDYCNLINELYPEVFDENKEKQPYKLEMLLFWIAKEEIINDINNCHEFDKKEYYHPEVLKRKKQTQKHDSKNNENSILNFRERILFVVDAGNGNKRLGVCEWKNNPTESDKVIIKLPTCKEIELKNISYKKYGTLTHREINKWINGNDYKPKKKLLFKFFDQDGVHKYEFLKEL